MNFPLAALNELLGFHYDRRERVYDLMEQIKPDQFVQTMQVGWGSLRTTLLHCLEVEDYWVQFALRRGERPDYDPKDFGDIAAVRQLAREVRQRTESFVNPLSEQDLQREVSITYSSGTTVRFTVAKALMHLVLHDTHHRGQVMALARQLGYEPPEIDLM